MTTNITRRGGTVAGRRLADGALHPERTEEEDKDDDHPERTEEEDKDDDKLDGKENDEETQLKQT